MDTQDLQQGTDAWFDARLGSATASRIKDILARTKSSYAASRKNYMAQLVLERLTGKRAPTFTTQAMIWGSEQEQFARSFYEMMHYGMVEEVGFIPHPTINHAGASPDGLVGDDGLWEGKCPQPATHFEYIDLDEPPTDYVYQTQWQMACTGRKWCDLMSYHPDFPTELQSKIWRIDRDDALIATIESEVVKFLTETDEMEKKYRSKMK